MEILTQFLLVPLLAEDVLSMLTADEIYDQLADDVPCYSVNLHI